MSYVRLSAIIAVSFLAATLCATGAHAKEVDGLVGPQVIKPPPLPPDPHTAKQPRIEDPKPVPKITLPPEMPKPVEKRTLGYVKPKEDPVRMEEHKTDVSTTENKANDATSESKKEKREPAKTNSDEYETDGDKKPDRAP